MGSGRVSTCVAAQMPKGKTIDPPKSAGERKTYEPLHDRDPGEEPEFFAQVRRGGRHEAGDPAEAGERVCGGGACGAGRHLGQGGGRPAGTAGGRGRPPEVQGCKPEGHQHCPGGRYPERDAAPYGRCRAGAAAGRQADGL